MANNPGNQQGTQQDLQVNQGGRRGRGFASMDEVRQREIASEGGKAAHASGNAHKFTSEEARVAGRKGGLNSHSGRSGSAQQIQESGNTLQTGDSGTLDSSS